MTRILYIGVIAEASRDIAQVIQQGCPSARAVWALLFHLVIRLIRARIPRPRDELSLFADDMAALAAVLAHLLALLRFFNALRIAASLALNYSKTLIVNYGVLSQTSSSSAA